MLQNFVQLACLEIACPQIAFSGFWSQMYRLISASGESYTYYSSLAISYGVCFQPPPDAMSETADAVSIFYACACKLSGNFFTSIEINLDI